MKELDSEAIIEARISGEPEHKIAKRFGCSYADVMDALGMYATRTLTGALRTNTLAIELARLERLHKRFEHQAIAEGDPQAAQIVLKAIERRSILLGIAAPPRHDPQLIEMQIQPKQTSTERIFAAIAAVKALPAQEIDPETGDPPLPEQDKTN